MRSSNFVDCSVVVCLLVVSESSDVTMIANAMSGASAKGRCYHLLMIFQWKRSRDVQFFPARAYLVLRGTCDSCTFSQPGPWDCW